MKRLLSGVFGCMSFALSLSAGLITSAPVGGATTTFPGGDFCSAAASTGTVAGFSLTSTGSACYNYSEGFGFGSNGFWDISIVGDDSGVTKITIDLEGLYSSVGGFMNYAPGMGSPVIAVLAADGTTVLESFDLSVSAPITSSSSAVDYGEFRGISLAASDIRYFQLSGSYIGMHDITLSGGSAIPEPTTILLAGLALAAICSVRRRRNRQTN